MRFMNEEERTRQLFEERLRQAEEEQQKPQPDLYMQRSTGCLIGGILGPILLSALLFIGKVFYPEDAAGGPLAYLFLFVVAVPVGGIFTAIISPFVVSWAMKLRKRNRH